MTPHGNLDKLRTDCEAIRVWSGGNHLPLIWKPFSSWRAAMFRMANILNFEVATSDRSLLDALQVALDNENRKSEWLPDEVDLSFASDRWRILVLRYKLKAHPTNRRYLEIWVVTGKLRQSAGCEVTH